MFSSANSWLVADLLAPTINMRFNGNSGVKTHYGVCLTFTYIITVICSAYFILHTYLSPSFPLVIEESRDSGKAIKVHLDQEGLLPFLFFVKDETTYVPVNEVSRYFTLQFSKYKFRSVMKGDGTSETVFTKIEIPILPCKTLESNSSDHSPYTRFREDPLIKRIGEDYGLCIQREPEETYIDGLGTETDFDMMTLEVFPCSKGTECASLNEVRRVSLGSSFSTSSLNISNFENPVSFSMSVDNFYYINECTKQKFQKRVVTSEIIDDGSNFKSFFSGPNVRTKYFKYDSSLQTSNIRSRNPAQVICSKEEILNQDCDSYLQIEMMSTSKEEKVIRKYKSLTLTFSELGGINSFVFLLFFYFNSHFAGRARKRMLTHEVFNFFDILEKKSDNNKAQKKEHIQAEASPSKKRLGSEARENESFADLGKDNELLDDDIFGVLDEATIKTMKKDAFCMIEETIDIVTIVKEIMHIRIFLRMILEDYHMKILPLIVYSQGQLSNGHEKKGAQNNLGSGKKVPSTIASNQNLSLELDLMDKGRIEEQANKLYGLKSAIKKLENKVETKPEGNDETLREDFGKQLKTAVDKLFINNLPLTLQKSPSKSSQKEKEIVSDLPEPVEINEIEHQPNEQRGLEPILKIPSATNQRKKVLRRNLRIHPSTKKPHTSEQPSGVDNNTIGRALTNKNQSENKESKPKKT